jgi:hypothetical protein
MTEEFCLALSTALFITRVQQNICSLSTDYPLDIITSDLGFVRQSGRGLRAYAAEFAYRSYTERIIDNFSLNLLS